MTTKIQTTTEKGAPTVFAIDATDKSLGRVASVAAHALLGKRSARYSQARVANVRVVIENADQLNLVGRRISGKRYQRYTGYPGGQRTTGMAEVIAKKGIAEVIRKTVDGMIPRNRLRKERMKNLIIKP